jgi:hypothetical protein
MELSLPRRRQRHVEVIVDTLTRKLSLHLAALLTWDRIQCVFLSA